MKMSMKLISLAEFCILSIAEIEFVALSDTVLNVLVREDPELKKALEVCFQQASYLSFPFSWRAFSDAYFVNTDPAGEPGEHCLAIWTRNRVCKVFDSYVLPLSTYKNPQLQAWFKQWKEVVASDTTIQAMDSQTSGHYALMFLKAKAHGTSLQERLAQWNSHNLLLSNQRVAQSFLSTSPGSIL